MHEKIRDLMTTLSGIVKEINNLEKIVNTHADFNVKEMYKKQYKTKVEEYLALCKKLEQEVLVVINHEKENNLPVNLTYRSILKKIGKVLGKR